jgi:hypothetical protein
LRLITCEKTMKYKNKNEAFDWFVHSWKCTCPICSVKIH